MFLSFSFDLVKSPGRTPKIGRGARRTRGLVPLNVVSLIRSKARAFALNFSVIEANNNNNNNNNNNMTGDNVLF